MGGSRSPGPVCGHSNSVEIDKGTSVRQQSSTAGSAGLRKSVPACAGIPVDTLVFDQDAVMTLLETTARAKIAERHTKLLWKEYNESTVLNVIYSILPYEKPGIVEVSTGDVHKVMTQTQEETDRLTEQFVQAVSRGAGPAVRFLDAQQKIRNSCQLSVSDVYREAKALNEAMQSEAQRAVARLTLIKASSTIAFKTAALIGGGMPAFLMGTGYDVTLNLIKDWDKAPDAKLVGVTTKTGDKLWKQAVKEAAKNMAYIYKQEESAPARKAGWLEKRLALMEKQLEGQANAERLKKYSRDGRRLQRAQKAAASARWNARAFSSVKFVFFAWDVYNATQDARENFESAGYNNSWDGIKDAFSTQSF